MIILPTNIFSLRRFNPFNKYEQILVGDAKCKRTFQSSLATLMIKYEKSENILSKQKN